ncbi:helix-turn-helix transcriptional regulator [Nocardia sp. XZ_19_385]|uniref:helix-turn-helix domain-containing protein n=1 Tax=Nocardia sp. XZ_19_385 TaxID=2769488 RepID=UPI0028152504|nr:helix-turn-helix transcriptional regulator [Nocardia sp. XZ_19_385]
MTDVHEAREALGQQLRDLRKDAGLTGRQLATSAGWHPAKISKIEHGKQTPTEDDVRAWCNHTRSPHHVADLIATLRHLDAAYIEWRRICATGTRRRQQQSVSLEAETKLIRGYDPGLVPGLLHTPEYAGAILRQVADFYRTPNDVETAVAVRMERQQRYLYRGDHRVHYLIGEQALYTTVGDDDVMLGQLDRLLIAIALPRVELNIVPLASNYVVPQTNFVIYDQRLVQVEAVTAELSITQPREIALYEKAFRAMVSQSATGKSARGLIRKALDARTGTS